MSPELGELPSRPRLTSAKALEILDKIASHGRVRLSATPRLAAHPPTLHQHHHHHRIAQMNQCKFERAASAAFPQTIGSRLASEALGSAGG